LCWRWLPVTLIDGRQVSALVFVIDPDHVKYCGGLPLEDQGQIIAQAVGGHGYYNCSSWSVLTHMLLAIPMSCPRKWPNGR
jgi:cation transport protein ChaC